MDGKRRSWNKRQSIQWVIDQMEKSVVQDVKPEGISSLNYDKSLADKHLVYCARCSLVYDRVYGDIYPDFPKYGKERHDHKEEECRGQDSKSYDGYLPYRDDRR